MSTQLKTKCAEMKSHQCFIDCARALHQSWTGARHRTTDGKTRLGGRLANGGIICPGAPCAHYIIREQNFQLESKWVLNYLFHGPLISVCSLFAQGKLANVAGSFQFVPNNG